MEQPTPTQTFKRNPFEIIGECFSIYGKRFKTLFLIALIMQIPLGVFEFAMADNLPSADDLERLQVNFLPLGDTQGAPTETGSTESSEQPEPLSRDEITELAVWAIGHFIIMTVLQTFTGGMIAWAIVMQYAFGRISIAECYHRAFWRVLTLVMLGLVAFGLSLLTVLGFALILPGIVMLALLVYWSVATPSAVIEGRKPIAALRRSFELVRGNWWRTFAAWLLTILVIFGLSLLLAIPMGLAEGLSEGTMRVANTLMSMLATAIVLPIGATTAALIYLDLRSRKEDYDLGSLAEQMGAPAPSSG